MVSCDKFGLDKRVEEKKRIVEAGANEDADARGRGGGAGGGEGA